MRKIWRQPILPALLAAAVAAAAIHAKAENDRPLTFDGVAAYVNKQTITIGEIRELTAPAIARIQDHYRDRDLEEQVRAAYRRAKYQLVERALVLDAYERNEEKIPEKILESRIREIKHQQYGGDRHVLEQQLTLMGLTLDELKKRMREELVFSFMFEREIESRIAISPENIRRAYAAAIEQYREPARVRLQVIEIRDGENNNSNGREQAVELLSRLHKNACFETLAREYSEGRGASDGGDWGWLEQDELRSEMATPLRELPIKTISDVITINERHYIIRVMDRHEERVTPLAEAYGEIQRELRQRKTDRLYTKWINRLESRAFVHRLEGIFE